MLETHVIEHEVTEDDVNAVSINLWYLTDILTQRALPGDDEKANALSTQHIAFHEVLLEKHPASEIHTQRLSESELTFGYFLFKRWKDGDFDLALTHYTRGLKLMEDLVKRDKKYQSELPDYHSRIGELFAKRGLPSDLDNAIAHFENAIAFIGTLRPSSRFENPYANSGSLIRPTLATLYEKRNQPGDTERGLAHHRQYLEAAEEWFNNEPDSIAAFSNMVRAREGIIASAKARGDTESAKSHQRLLSDFRGRHKTLSREFNARNNRVVFPREEMDDE